MADKSQVMGQCHSYATGANESATGKCLNLAQGLRPQHRGARRIENIRAVKKSHSLGFPTAVFVAVSLAPAA